MRGNRVGQQELNQNQPSTSQTDPRVPMLASRRKTDLEVFERELKSQLSRLKNTRFFFQIILGIVFLLFAYTFWSWWCSLDEEESQWLSSKSLMPMSLLGLLLFMALGFYEDKIAARRTTVRRMRRVLATYNLSCDYDGNIIVLKNKRHARGGQGMSNESVRPLQYMSGPTVMGNRGPPSRPGYVSSPDTSEVYLSLNGEQAVKAAHDGNANGHTNSVDTGRSNSSSRYNLRHRRHDQPKTTDSPTPSSAVPTRGAMSSGRGSAYRQPLYRGYEYYRSEGEVSFSDNGGDSVGEQHHSGIFGMPVDGSMVMDSDSEFLALQQKQQQRRAGDAHLTRITTVTTNLKDLSPNRNARRADDGSNGCGSLQPAESEMVSAGEPESTVSHTDGASAVRGLRAGRNSVPELNSGDTAQFTPNRTVDSEGTSPQRGGDGPSSYRRTMPTQSRRLGRLGGNF
eukprot:Clim_evm35s251 gene=Clim_evmTU35s251